MDDFVDAPRGVGSLDVEEARRAEVVPPENTEPQPHEIIAFTCFPFCFPRKVRESPTAWLLFKIWLATTAALLFIILMSLSFTRVHEREQGIVYDFYREKVITTVESGLHAHGPGREIFIYPRAAVRESFTEEENDVLACKTNDGISLLLTLDLQYSIISDSLEDSLFDLGKAAHVEQHFIAMARSALREVCGAFTYNAFITARASIDTAMFDVLKVRAVETNSYVEPLFVQLLNVRFPDALSAAIEAKEVARQDIDRAASEREQAIIDETTRLRKQVEVNKVAIIRAEADADATLSHALGEVESELIYWDELARSYETVQTALNFTPTELLAYLRATALGKVSGVAGV